MTYRDAIRSCPRCRSAMEQIAVGSKNIDRCPQCKGTFLDYSDGELVNISKMVPTEKGDIATRVPTVWTKEKIVDKLKADFFDRTGIDLGNDEVAMQRIAVEAEEVFVELQGRDDTSVSIPFITFEEGKGLHLETTLTNEAPKIHCCDCDLDMELTEYLDDGPLVYRCGGCLSLFATGLQWMELSAYQGVGDPKKRRSWWSRLKLFLDERMVPPD